MSQAALKPWKNERVYNSANAYFTDILLDIANCERSIEVESYIFADDGTGNRIFAALEAACQRGIQVRLLVDGVGSNYWLQTKKRAIENSPVEVKIYHPLPWPLGSFRSLASTSPRLLYWINKRNHKKLFLIDGKIAYTGSINIFDQALEWRESGIRIEGGDLTEVNDSFNFGWTNAEAFSGLKPSRFKQIIAPKSQGDNPLVETNINLRQRRNYNQRWIDAMNAATQRIWITSPYFVPPLAMIKALCHGAQQGRDIRLLLPEKSDVPPVKLVGEYYYEKLLGAGVKIYEYQKGILHAKITIIDHLAAVSTSNYNHRSFFHDLELTIIPSSEASVMDLITHFKADLKVSRQVTLDDVKKRGFFKRLLAKILLLLKNVM